MNPPDALKRGRNQLALLAGIALVGIALRINHLLGGRAFWVDELSIVENLQARDYSQLFEPLASGQMAPYGFLAILKWFGASFGYTEIVLRLPLFFVGVASLLLFMWLARSAFRPSTAMLASLLFAACDWLIYYSAEAKQYGLDAFAAVLLYLVAFPLLEKWTWPRLCCLAVLAAAIVWVSHPAAFVLAAIGLVLMSQQYRAGRLSNAALVLVACLPALFSFVLHLHATSALGSQNTADMQEIYWTQDFMPFPPRSVSDLMWFPNSLLGLFAEPLGFRLTGLAAVLAVIGCWSLHSRGKLTVAVMLLLPLGIALAASGAKLYPFYGRFLVFSIPGLLFVLAEGLTAVVEATWRRARVVSVAVVAIALLFPLLVPARQAMARIPYGTENLPEVLPFVREHYREGDLIYLYYAAHAGFRYYAPRYGLGEAHTLPGQSPGDKGWQAYLDDADLLGCQNRVWIVFSHSKRHPEDEEQMLLHLMDRQGRRVESIVAFESPLFEGHTGAAAYLYEMRPAARCQQSPPG